MGAKAGNQNAKKPRTRVTACLSISDEQEYKRLTWAIQQLEQHGIEPTDQAVSWFVRSFCYEKIDEAIATQR